ARIILMARTRHLRFMRQVHRRSGRSTWPRMACRLTTSSRRTGFKRECLCDCGPLGAISLFFRVLPFPQLLDRDKDWEEFARGRHHGDLEPRSGEELGQAHDESAIDAAMSHLAECTGICTRLQKRLGI